MPSASRKIICTGSVGGTVVFGGKVAKTKVSGERTGTREASSFESDSSPGADMAQQISLCWRFEIIVAMDLM